MDKNLTADGFDEANEYTPPKLSTEATQEDVTVRDDDDAEQDNDDENDLIDETDDSLQDDENEDSVLDPSRKEKPR